MNPSSVARSLCHASRYGARAAHQAVAALDSVLTDRQVFCVWLTPNQDLAYVLATGYVASSILLSGFYLSINDMKLGFMKGLSYLSYTK